MEEHYDLIERYLDGTLSDTERQEVERRLAADPDFGAEVRLHRAMQTSLEDKGNLRLRAALDRLLRNPPVVGTPLPNDMDTAPATAPNWFRRLGMMAVLVLTGLVLWRWLASDDEKTINEPIPQQQDTIAPVKQPDTLPAPMKNTSNKPIAMADPTDFAPNPLLEAKIGDLVRGAGIAFELTGPASGATWQLENGQVTLPIQGVASGEEVPADQPLALLIYSNRPEDWAQNKPVEIFPISLIPLEEGHYRVDFRPTLRVRPGLYYLIIGQQRLAEDGGGHKPLWVDKFVVREK